MRKRSCFQRRKSKISKEQFGFLQTQTGVIRSGNLRLSGSIPLQGSVPLHTSIPLHSTVLLHGTVVLQGTVLLHGIIILHTTVLVCIMVQYTNIKNAYIIFNIALTAVWHDIW